MVDREFFAAAAGGLHTAHCARRDRHQGPPALASVASTTLLGADPPRSNDNYRSTISSWVLLDQAASSRSCLRCSQATHEPATSPAASHPSTAARRSGSRRRRRAKASSASSRP